MNFLEPFFMGGTAKDRDVLVLRVTGLLNQSVSLTVDKKDVLRPKLAGLTDAQLTELVRIFTDEEQMKNQALQAFFTTRPEMYREFEQFVQNMVNEVYRKIEDSERSEDEARITATLNDWE